MRIVYLAHPVSGDVAGNLARAKRWYKWIATNFDVAIIADWIVTCEVLDDSREADRALGMAMNDTLISHLCCDEVWLVGGRVSAGMSSEWALADDLDLAVKDLTFLGAEPPEILSQEVRALIGPARKHT